MTKQQLIERFAQAQGISRQTAKLIVEEMFRMMTDILVEGDRVEIRGFGSFSMTGTPQGNQRLGSRLK